MHSSNKKTKKFTSKQRIQALFKVLKIAYKASPIAIFVRITNSIITAVVPIIIAYYAAA